MPMISLRSAENRRRPAVFPTACRGRRPRACASSRCGWLAVCLGGICLTLSASTLAQRGSAGYVPQVNQGQAALAQHRWTSAASHFRFALQWDRDGVDAHNGLGEVYLHFGRKARAIDEFNAALRLKPHSADAERGLKAARSEGEAEDAFDELQEQVQREPNDADAHTSLAEDLLDRGQLEAAQKEARVALSLDPKMGHAYCALGRIAARQGQDDEARKDLEIAVKMDSSDDDAFATLGDLALKVKEYRLAVTYYRRVVSIMPDETEGHQRLLDALTASGDTRGAEREKAIIMRLSVSG